MCWLWARHLVRHSSNFFNWHKCTLTVYLAAWTAMDFAICSGVGGLMILIYHCAQVIVCWTVECRDSGSPGGFILGWWVAAWANSFSWVSGSRALNNHWRVCYTCYGIERLEQAQGMKSLSHTLWCSINPLSLRSFSGQYRICCCHIVSSHMSLNTAYSPLSKRWKWTVFFARKSSSSCLKPVWQGKKAKQMMVG